MAFKTFSEMAFLEEIDMFSSITPVKQRDSCLALTLLFLLCLLFTQKEIFLYLAIAGLLFGMIWPASMKPFGWAWFGLAQALGKVTSSILLVIVWFVLVLPVGLFRRLLGKDVLHLRKWRKSDQSAFIERDHEYACADLEKPY